MIREDGLRCHPLLHPVEVRAGTDEPPVVVVDDIGVYQHQRQHALAERLMVGQFGERVVRLDGPVKGRCGGSPPRRAGAGLIVLGAFLSRPRDG